MFRVCAKLGFIRRAAGHHRTRAMHASPDAARTHGFNLDMSELGYPGDRNDVADYLGSLRWQTVATKVTDLFAAEGLS